MFKEKEILQALKNIDNKLGNLIAMQKSLLVKKCEQKQNEETQIMLLTSILLSVLPLINDINGGDK